MTPISLSSITYSQGLQLLAARKQALDSGHITRMSKEAMATSFPLRDIGADYIEKIAESGLLDSLKSGFGGMSDKIKSSLGSMDGSTRNVLLSGLAGAGVGAGTGAASALLNGEEGAGWKALQGGLAGGAVGGGLGLAFNPEVLSKAFQLEKRPGITSSLPANASNAQRSAAQIKSRTPAEQLAEINKLQGVADSSMPEITNYTAHGLNTAAAGGAGAYIANKATYDPDVIAKSLRSEILNSTGLAGSTSSPKGAINLNKLNAALRNGAVTPGGVPLADFYRNLSEEQLKNLLPKSFISGMTPSRLKPTLAAGLTDDLAKSILERSQLSGMRTMAGKIRPGKLGLLGLLAGGWGLGRGAISQKYQQDSANRNEAKDTLNALRTALMPDQTANTMQ